MNEVNVKQILEMQDENYQARIGTTFGLFRIDDVKYNWDAHTQEWTVTCTKCNHSEIVVGSVGRDWMRGKGRSRNKCKYCKEAERELKNSEKNKKTQEREDELNAILGSEINGWLISKRNDSSYDCICQECGRKRMLKYSQIAKKKCTMCDKVDYSDPIFIGKKYGNLTIIKHIGGDFLVKCDCGFEKLVKCSAINNGKTTTCGRIECEYHINAMNSYGKHGEIIRGIGEKAEKDIQEWLTALGYSVKKTPQSGDFGVDLIAVGKDESLVAIQVKHYKESQNKTGVNAVQEVFAGGHYYGCTKFAVVSYTGYTENAKQMADKLGVMLLTERCELWKSAKEIKAQKAAEKYNKTHPEINGERKTITEWCDYYGVSEQFVHYRITKMGMTLENALKTPKVQQGRPKKAV